MFAVWMFASEMAMLKIAVSSSGLILSRLPASVSERLVVEEVEFVEDAGLAADLRDDAVEGRGDGQLVGREAERAAQRGEGILRERQQHVIGLVDHIHPDQRAARKRIDAVLKAPLTPPAAVRIFSVSPAFNVAPAFTTCSVPAALALSAHGEHVKLPRLRASDLRCAACRCRTA